MRDYTIHCLSEAVSPISHASGSVGNESVIAREPVVSARGKRFLPFLSGNALRHRCVREPGVLWLINRWELVGKLSKDQLNFMLHGGNLTLSTAHENTARIAEYNRLFPLLKLVGGCLPDQILKGSIQVWRGVLVCEENRPVLSRTLPDSWRLPTERMQSAEDMTGNWQYTRGDAKKTGLCPPEEVNEDASNLMIFAGQAVSRGSFFHHGFQINHVTELEVGALLHAISMWQESGGTIGGMAARGHGRLKTSIHFDGDQKSLVAGYVKHVDAVREDGIAWLNNVFAAAMIKRETAAAKKKNGKKKAADTEGE